MAHQTNGNRQNKYTSIIRTRSQRPNLANSPKIGGRAQLQQKPPSSPRTPLHQKVATDNIPLLADDVDDEILLSPYTAALEARTQFTPQLKGNKRPRSEAYSLTPKTQVENHDPNYTSRATLSPSILSPPHKKVKPSSTPEQNYDLERGQASSTRSSRQLLPALQLPGDGHSLMETEVSPTVHSESSSARYANEELAPQSPAISTHTPLRGLSYLTRRISCMSPLTPLPSLTATCSQAPNQLECVIDEEEEDEILLSPSKSNARSGLEMVRTPTKADTGTPVLSDPHECDVFGTPPAKQLTPSRSMQMVSIPETRQMALPSGYPDTPSPKKIPDLAREPLLGELGSALVAGQTPPQGPTLQMTLATPPRLTTANPPVAAGAVIQGNAPPTVSRLPLPTPARNKVAFTPLRHGAHLNMLSQMSPLTPIPPTPMIGRPLFGAAAAGAQLFRRGVGTDRILASPRKHTAALSPTKESLLSPTKTRIPAPIKLSSPPQAQPSPPKVQLPPKSAVKTRLRQGATKPGAGAKGKATILASQNTLKQTAAKRLAASKLSPNKLGHMRTAMPPPTFGYDKQKGNTVRALTGLDKALERLSLPKPARPSMLGYHASDSALDMRTAKPIVLPTLLHTTASGSSGAGKVRLSPQRPGGTVNTGPHMNTILEDRHSSSEDPHLPEIAHQLPRTESATRPGEILAVKSTKPTSHVQSQMPENPIRKVSVDDIVLKLNGIRPHASDVLEIPSDVSTTTVPEVQEPSKPRLSNSVRVATVSRMLSVTVAQRNEIRKVSQQPVLAHRPIRAVRTASTNTGPEGLPVKQRPNSRMAGSLDVLKSCVVHVDVATEDGEGAGGLFVEMLKGLGARILSKPGRICTHVVFKNGSDKTVTQWRSLPEPRPKVVGIGWVVECAEKRQKVAEKPFMVDLTASASVPGSGKRQRSIKPFLDNNNDQDSGYDTPTPSKISPVENL